MILKFSVKIIKYFFLTKIPGENMDWTDKSKKELSRVPFFVRKKVKKKVEEYACEKGAEIIEPAHLHEARKNFLNKMEDEIKGYRVEVCMGGSNCENAVDTGKRLADKAEDLLKSKDLFSFLRKNTKGKIKFHQEFKVSISYCPNSCSRPQITDIGIIAADKPVIKLNECIGCGLCVKKCMERAISFKEEICPVIDFDKCLYCGACIKICPSKTIDSQLRGFRVLAGGKLGRHPVLGIELDGIFTEDEVLKIIENSVNIMKSQTGEAKRFADIFDKKDIDKLTDFKKYRYVEDKLIN